MNDVRVGTSGWSYPSGKGTWNGIFYPVPARARSAARHANGAGPGAPASERVGESEGRSPSVEWMDATDVLIDDRPVPYTRELWLPLMWFLIR
jgi:hypothetical protein